MKLSQSFVVVSLSVAAQSQIGLSAPMPKSPEPNSLSPNPSRSAHRIRSPSPNPNTFSARSPEPHSLLDPSVLILESNSRQRSNYTPLQVTLGLKKREDAPMRKNSLDGLLEPLGIPSLDATVAGLPVVGGLISTAVLEPVEKALDPTVSSVLKTVTDTVAPLPLVGDVIKSTHLGQRGLLDPVKQLPVIGGIVSPPLTTVGDALQPVVDSVTGAAHSLPGQRGLLDPVKQLPVIGGIVSPPLSTVGDALQPVVDSVTGAAHSLPVVGAIIPTNLTLNRRHDESAKPAAEPLIWLSSRLGLKKRQNVFNPFTMEPSFLSQAGGALPIQPSRSLDHLTLPNDASQSESANGQVINWESYPAPRQASPSTTFPDEMMPLRTAPRTSTTEIFGRLSMVDEYNPKPYTRVKGTPLSTIDEEEEPQETSRAQMQREQSEQEEYVNDEPSASESSRPKDRKQGKRDAFRKLFKKRSVFINQTKNDNKNRFQNFRNLIAEVVR